MAKRISNLATADTFKPAAGSENIPNNTNDTLNPPIEDGGIPISDNTSVIITTPESINKHLKALDNAVSSLEKTFYKIAFNIFCFHDTNGFVSIKGKGYNTIMDFCKDRYGISKTTTYN